MRKWLKNTLCATVVGMSLASSGCLFGKGDDKKKEDPPTFKLKKHTKEGYRIILEKTENLLTINFYDPKMNLDHVYLVDYDFDKKNGIDRVVNWTRDTRCHKKVKKDQKTPVCSEYNIKRANEMFRYALRELGYDSNLKPIKGVTGGW